MLLVTANSVKRKMIRVIFGYVTHLILEHYINISFWITEIWFLLNDIISKNKIDNITVWNISNKIYQKNQKVFNWSPNDQVSLFTNFRNVISWRKISQLFSFVAIHSFNFIRMKHNNCIWYILLNINRL